MPLFMLSEEIAFPHPKYADEDGLLAVGGDLSIDRLILAYKTGIFPWYNEGDPILWWSPLNRTILIPNEIKISKSMLKVIKKNRFRATFDKCFRDVVSNCRELRISSGTWITNDMIEAYCELHERGYAHSVEVWNNDDLVGGLYGVSLGRCFFGESMFSKVTNASKFALIHLANVLKENGFDFIDCQMYTDHLKSMGAKIIKRSDFLRMLHIGTGNQTLLGNWEEILK